MTQQPSSSRREHRPTATRGVGQSSFAEHAAVWLLPIVFVGVLALVWLA